MPAREGDGFPAEDDALPCAGADPAGETAPGAYTYIWQFDVRPGREREFEALYGSDGDWARLFRRGAGYLGTLLLRDADVAGRYLTIDSWQSEAEFEAFRARFGREFDVLDRRGEELTVREARIGRYSRSGVRSR